MRRQRYKFLGRHIMVKGKYVEKILNGRKRATVRKGLVKTKYPEIIIHGGGRPVAKARIKAVIYKKVGELTDEDARLDGFNSREELIRELRRVYGELSEEDWVTIIEFEVVQRLDNLPVEKPYHGLAPGDLARIALRYLRDELSNEDIRVLEDLTRTNSIRATAYRLYGNIDKRNRVRKTLRKVLKILEEKGIMGSGEK